MKNVKEQAKLAALRSRCKNCPLHPHRCTTEILKVCTDSFIEGYVKGANMSKKKLIARCFLDTNKRCNQCHKCDIDILNPNY